MEKEAFTPGAVLAGRFQLEQRLGRGGFGTVWRARDLELRELVAVKILNPEIAQSEEGRERFLKEIKATRAFVHKYAVQPRDFGRDPERDVLFFTMGLVEGPTLRKVLQDAPGGRIEPGRAVRVASQVLEVLEEAHAAGLVHRDLKPDNLILTQGREGAEEVRVLDFGIAKAVSVSSGSRAEETSGLTLTGTTIGTLNYMSPEQAQGRRIDGRADLYSVGVILYECIAGRRPVEPEADAEDSRQSLLYALATKVPRALGEVAPVPPHVASAVMKTLEKLPESRFASARDLRTALASPGPAASMTGLPTGASPVVTLTGLATGVEKARTATGLPTGAAKTPPPLPEAPPRSRSWLLAVPVLAAIGVGSWMLRPAPPPPSPGNPAPAPPPPPAPPGAPELAVDEPTEGTVTSATRIALSGRATGGAHVLVNGAEVALSGDRFQSTIALREGDARIVVEARLGGPANRIERHVVCDTEPPGVTLRAGDRELRDREVVGRTPLAVRIVVTDEHPGTSIRVNGREERWPSAALERPLDLVEGENELSLVATDAAGNATERRVRIVLDTRAPDLALTSPPGGRVETRSTQAVIAGTVSDKTAVTVTIDGKEAPLDHGTFREQRDLPDDGPRTFRVVARDEAGNAATAEAVFVRKTKGPLLRLDVFAAPDLVNVSGELEVGGTVGDTATEVSVAVKGKQPVPASSIDRASGRFVVRVPLDVGRNKIVARARDALGNETESETEIYWVKRVKVGRIKKLQPGYGLVLVTPEGPPAKLVEGDALVIDRDGRPVPLAFVKVSPDGLLQCSPGGAFGVDRFKEDDQVWREIRK